VAKGGLGDVYRAGIRSGDLLTWDFDEHSSGPPFGDAE